MAYWICQVAGWGAYFVFQSAATAFGGNLAFGGTPLVAAMALSGLIFSHLLRFWLKRTGWVALRPGAMVPRLLGAAAVMGALTSLVVWAEIVWIGGIPFAETSFRYYIFGVVNWSGLFALWLALYVGVKAYQRTRAAEAAARTAQLDTLKAQLNPHFLFNALNSIRALIAEDPARAQTAVTELSELLRHNLQTPAAHLVPLDRELEAVRHYLRLEQIRYEERLRVDEQIAAEALPARIPPMLLQTLVENAIKHGIARTPAGGVLGIHADLRNGRLRIVVTNPGALGNGSGIGLTNARKRLTLLSPGSSLTLAESPASSVTATVEIVQ